MESKKSTALTRRDFVKTAAIAGTVLAAYRLPIRSAMADMPVALATYNSPQLTLFADPLRGVNVIPVAAPDGYRYWILGNVQRFKPPIGKYTTATHYTIDIKQFSDILHSELVPLPTEPTSKGTCLWGYQPSKFFVPTVNTQRHLGGIIVARRGQPVQITFRNKLPATHILPVDTTIPGAAQQPNRVATHLHGGLVPWISDGGPFDWWDPNGNHGDSFLNNAVLNPKTLLNPGAGANEAEYYYPNDQSARMVWYHDHAFGITRLNAYAGIASAYIIRDAFEDYLRDHMGLPEYIENGGPEIPLVFQDKIFVDGTNPDNYYPLKTNGALWYPYVYPDTPASGAPNPLPIPSVVPEMFGDTILVNGAVIPKVTLDAKRYRFRILNACNARFLNLQLLEHDGSPDGVTIENGVATNLNKGPDFLVIGSEGGFLPKPVLVNSRIPFNTTSLLNFSPDPLNPTPIFPANPPASLLTAPAERWDVVIDFAGKHGKKFVLYNDAPSPFPGGGNDTDYYYGSLNGLTPVEGKSPNTRVLMCFDINPAVVADNAFTITPATDFIHKAQTHGLTWNDPLLDPTGIPVRKLTLNEVNDTYGRLIQMIGTNIPVSAENYGLEYQAPPTEVVGKGQTEIWEIANLTGDVHPMHFHLVNVQIINRQHFNNYAAGVPTFDADPVPPPDTELGWKETVKMYPDTVTRVIMKFDLPNVPFEVPESPRTGGHEYVWHCHILEHEEHDVMRPLIVMDNLSVTPSLAAIISLIGGKATFQVSNAIGDFTVNATGLPASCPLTIDQPNRRFTVTVPKNAKMARGIVTVNFKVSDSSNRPLNQKSDTATLKITNLI